MRAEVLHVNRSKPSVKARAENQRRKSVQAKLYLSASTQFEQKQGKPQWQQRRFECKSKGLRDTKSKHESNKSLTQTDITHSCTKEKEKKAPYVNVLCHSLLK